MILLDFIFDPNLTFWRIVSIKGDIYRHRKVSCDTEFLQSQSADLSICMQDHWEITFTMLETEKDYDYITVLDDNGFVDDSFTFSGDLSELENSENIVIPYGKLSLAFYADAKCCGGLGFSLIFRVFLSMQNDSSFEYQDDIYGG